MDCASKHLVVLSPHLDDAVLSCGEVLASSPGATVATLFAGSPPPGAAATSWDLAAGFTQDDDVIAIRRGEDRTALALLDARPVWLDFRDDQYGGAPAIGDLAEAIGTVLAGEHPDAVLFPCGLFHADHRRTHEASLRVMERFANCAWLMYEDALYRRIDRLLDERLEQLCAHGYAPRRVALATHAEARERKRAAVECYRSQLRALGTRRGHADALAPEGYWRIDGADVIR